MSKQKKQSYFQKHSTDFNLEQFYRSTNIREAQKGATFALLAHFSVDRQPAIVSMPTGTGKTAVIMLAPFLQMSKRTLIITSSRLVRGQIADDFQKLTTLTKIGVLATGIEKPNVAEVTERPQNKESWNEYSKFDVLVALPSSISPTIKGVFPSNRDFFDLVLFDEAHHVPADSWHDIMKHYPEARQALFTATPFRRDVLSLPGKLIYSYPVTKAFQEKTLRKIHFEAVTCDADNADLEIAKAAERVFNRDKAAGFNHRIVIRADKQARAEELHTLYSKETKLHLELIHSDLKFTQIKESIQNLLGSRIDGIICVDMLGEGFDFPQLKIAAIHAPHKSLAVTLQFIGRFGRINANDIGDATFVACPATVKIEGRRLYEEGVIWQEVIPELADIALQREEHARETFSKFLSIGNKEAHLDPAIIRTLHPFCHAQIFHVQQQPNFREPLLLGGQKEVAVQELSSDECTLVFVTREEKYPTWSRATELRTHDWHLNVLHYNEPHKLLFINSSQKSASSYKHLLEMFCNGVGYPVSSKEIQRILRGLSEYDIFNLGMRGRNKGVTTEAYKIAAGNKVDKSITPADPSRFIQGHVVFSAKDNNQLLTLGYSSSGKTWQNEYSNLPEYILWCDGVAEKISQDSEIITGTALDKLKVAERIEVIDFLVIAAVWGAAAFQAPPLIRYTSSNGVDRSISAPLTSFLVKNETAEIRDTINLLLQVEDNDYPLIFELAPNGGFKFTSSDKCKEANLRVIQGNEELSLEHYLDLNPLTLYTFDFGMLVGSSYCPSSTPASQTLEEAQFEIIDWKKANVNIRSEKRDTKKGISIFKFMETYLKRSADLVYSDDGAGEAADYISFKKEGSDLRIGLYHCKASSEETAGRRVKDIYEVSGQAIKSYGLVSSAERIFEQIKGRFSRQAGQATFVAGSIDKLDELQQSLPSYQPLFEVVIVQPGISIGQHAGSNVGQNLVGTAGILHSYGASFRIICSA